jgi:peptide/nickel transport system permease protein
MRSRTGWLSLLAAAAMIAVLLLLLFLVPLLPTYDPLGQSLARSMRHPFEYWANPLGTDRLGRDMLSRLSLGGRVSLTVTFATLLISATLGVTLGTLGGYLGGAADRIVMAMADFELAMPVVLLLVALAAVFGASIWLMIAVMGFHAWVQYGKVARGVALTLRGRDFVLASRLQGGGTAWVIRRHILPSVLPQIAIISAFEVGVIFAAQSGLDFLGLGVQPPTPSWGTMIADGQSYLRTNAWLCVLPGLAILCVVASAQLLSQTVTRERLRPAPRRRPAALRSQTGTTADSAGDALLSVRNLSVEIATPRGMLRPIHDVSFDVRRGECFGVIGESGSGKSLTMRAVLGLLPPNATIVSGRVTLEGRDITHLTPAARRQIAGRQIAMVAQDPMRALNPVRRIGAQIAEALAIHNPGLNRDARRSRVAALLTEVGIADAAERMGDFPHQWSGGMLQRAVIAMALANRPELLIADEPTTALDVTVQAQIMRLLGRLQAEHRMAMVLISHDLALVSQHSTRLAMMYAGTVVETGAARAIFAQPAHPYTIGLMKSVSDLTGGRAYAIPGAPPMPWRRDDGCPFEPRCTLGRSRPICANTNPLLRDVGQEHRSACHFPDESVAPEVAA